MDIADTNEYHPLTDAQKYAAWSPAVIMRAHNGYREDNAYAASIALAHAVAAIRAVGHYGYVVAAMDAAQQGRDFANTVKQRGGLRAGHFISFDLEEGAGDQAARAEAWLEGCRSVLAEPTAAEFGYAGSAFWQAHLWSVNNVHRWIAAYGQPTAPPLGEVLWQFTDAQVVPGVSGACDCSLFVGDVDMLLALITPQEETVPAFIYTCEGQPDWGESAAGNVIQLDAAAVDRWVKAGAKVTPVDLFESKQWAGRAHPPAATVVAGPAVAEKITLTGTETPG